MTHVTIIFSQKKLFFFFDNISTRPRDPRKRRIKKRRGYRRGRYNIGGGMEDLLESLAMGRVVPTEPTTVYDWIIFGWLVFVSVFIIASSVAIVVKRKRYAPLRTTTTANLLIMGSFGIVHGWSAFLSNQHFEMWLPITLLDCSLWTYWIQFAVGLSGWLIALLNRMLSHGFVLNKNLRYSGRMKRFFWRSVVFLMVFIPIMGICMGITRTGVAVYDPRMRSCYTPPLWKALVSAWMVWSLVLLCGLNVVVERGTRRSHMSEYKAVRLIVILATLTVMANNLISFTGLVNFSLGRCAYTFLLSFVYLISFAKLSSYKIYKALKDDREYEKRVLSDFRSCVVIYDNVRDLMQAPQLMEKFLDWCHDQEAESLSRERIFGTTVSASWKEDKGGGGKDDGKIFFQPNHVVKCYKRVREWKIMSLTIGPGISSDGTAQIDSLIQKSRDIVNDHMSISATYRIEAFTRSQINNISSNNTANNQPKNLFDFVEDRLIFLLQELWGYRWLQDFYHTEAMGLLDRFDRDFKSSEREDDDSEDIPLVDMQKTRRNAREDPGEGSNKDEKGKKNKKSEFINGEFTYYSVPPPNNVGVGAWTELGRGTFMEDGDGDGKQD